MSGAVQATEPELGRASWQMKRGGDNVRIRSLLSEKFPRVSIFGGFTQMWYMACPSMIGPSGGAESGD
jgi:hypothetical protein